MFPVGLKNNLLSISQLCDKGFKVTFEIYCYAIHLKDSNEVALIGKKHNIIYLIDIDHASSYIITFLRSMVVAYKSYSYSYGTFKESHVKRFSCLTTKTKISERQNCCACKKRKQVKSSFKSKNVISTSKPLELLHKDLVGPSKTKSLGGNYYALMIVDDYSKYSWTFFLTFKYEAFKAFKKFSKLNQNEKNLKISAKKWSWKRISKSIFWNSL